jgi:hypothetical protein
MLPEIGTQEFIDYLSEISAENKPKRHKYYDETVEHMHDMGVHVTGDNPKNLLDVKRPNEDDEAKDYRLKSYKPKTKSSANRAISVINRIYNERLYSVLFKDRPGKIGEQDDLGTYLTSGMPKYVSLMNYIKSVFTKMHMKDPNGVLAILPNNFDAEDVDYFTPIPVFFTSEKVVDYGDDYFVILKTEGDKYNKSYKILILTSTSVIVYKKGKGKDWNQDFEYVHNWNEVPAFIVGGVVNEDENYMLYESFIAGVLPHWDDAICMYSDLQASITNHIYPESYVWTAECDNQGCNAGKVLDKDATGKDCEVNCSTCGGTGKIVHRGPFNEIQINKDALNPDAPIPIPPKGYIDKELASTELLEVLAEKEIRKGYEAINMDILNQVGEDQSGIAKVIDRQDLDGFLEVYASNMFKYVLPNMIYFIAKWRYYEILNRNDTTFREYLPTLKQPTTFDVYSISLLTEEYSRLKESGVGGNFLTGIQKDIIEKRFPDERTKAFYTTIIDVDPLVHMSEDEILANSRVIDEVDLKVHVYAKDYIEELLAKDESFLTLPLAERKEKIRALAKSKKQPVIDVQPAE